MLLPVHVKMALISLKQAKWRSLLTMLGIIIGVVSVLTIVSIGEGVKRQLAIQVNKTSPNLITVRPGHVVNRNGQGDINSVNLWSAFGGATFSQTDFSVVAKTPGVEATSALSIVNGIPRIDSQIFDRGFVVGTTQDLPQVMGLKLAYGAFFSDTDTVKDGAVIGRNVAEQLFQENVPIGKAFTIRDQTFRVRGVLDNVKASPLVPYSAYNDAVFISLDSGRQLNGGSANIYEIIAKPEPAHSTAAIVSIAHNLQQAHGDQSDFTILKGTEAYAGANTVLQILTQFVAGVATISLVVGGIGIMNIMLVSVSERTREIGIRKAVGATNRQILMQFLTEATILSFCGGIIGVILSFIINYFIHILTSLQPAISWQIIGFAAVISIAVGIIFGVMPAIKASRKDPIEALRYI